MKKILLILVAYINLHALNIDEAIDRAMNNNPSLKEKELLFKASQESLNASYSGYKPKIDLFYNYSKFSKKSYVGANSASSASAVLSYNLFNGFLNLHKIKEKEENSHIAQYTHSASKADLKLQVTLTYIDYLRSKRQILIAQETITLLEQQLSDAKNFYEQGLFAKNDYLQVDVELSSAKQALLSSQSSINISFFKLRRLLGKQLKKDEIIEDVSRKQKEILFKILQIKMLENRSELKVLKAQKRALGYSYKVSSSPYYPKIDAEAKYQVAGVDFIPNGGPTFAVDKQAAIGIQANWNLYQGGADEATRASFLLQERASNERLNDLYLELDFQLEQSIQSYELSKSQIIVAKKALKQAKENFRITKNQFDANIANTILMLEAQRFLAQAQVDFYQANFALYDAMAEIERVVEEEIF
ncbi:TolC family protein [Sulfurimonas sp. MAG313]|nr:TolC family protein [Sulfurimonas sp. MAG313]MDF1882085.1 TolC family protein [Sulfurimonas sp. MAG313]